VRSDTDGLDDFLVLLLDCQFKHLTGVAQATVERVQGGYDGFETCAFTAQLLGLFRLVPDLGIFQFPVYFLEPVAFVCIVKDTP